MNTVIINEQHKILPVQHEQIIAAVGEYNILKVPLTGWTLAQQFEKIDTLMNVDAVIFISPLPVMITYLSRNSSVRVFVFHNDRREKVEKPDGTVFYKVPESGWELVAV